MTSHLKSLAIVERCVMYSTTQRYLDSLIALLYLTCGNILIAFPSMQHLARPATFHHPCP